MKTTTVAWIGITALAAASTALVCGAGSARTKAASVVAEIRHADYAGDRARLKALGAELEPLAADAKIGARVRYWQGFALWRRAFNGFNDNATPKDITDDLSAAIVDFDAALALDPSMVDAEIGAISCLSNLMYFDRKDPAAAREYLRRGKTRVDAAKKLDPENPRLAWVLGANVWYAPAEHGGGEAPALAIYEKGLAEARRRKASADPLEPSWGEPELLMNLAWANLNRATPDLDAADRYAAAALKIVPYWHYVRDVLSVQIREAKNETAK